MVTNSELEKLLDDYMQGVESFVTYRQKRMQLIRAFAYQNRPDVTVPKDTETTQTIKPVNLEKPELQIPTIEKEESNLTSKIITLAGMAALITFAGFTWYLSESDNSSDDASHSRQQAQDALPDKLNQAISNEVFVEEFLNTKTWDSETLSDFLLQWQALPRDRQTIARQSPAFIKLSDEIKKRMKDVISQKEAGDKDIERQEKLIIWFATELSLGVM